MTDDLVARLRAYDGRVWETTACYNGLREEAAAVLEQERGDARTLRGFVATYKMTPSMMASRAEIAEARIRELEAQLAEAYERAAKVADDSASANLGPYAARGDMARFVAGQIRKLAQEVKHEAE